MAKVLNMDDSYIDKKLQEDAMQKNLIKYWRVRFEDEEEEEERQEETKTTQPNGEEDLFANMDESDEDMIRAREIFERLQAEAAADDAALLAEQQAAYAAAEAATDSWKEKTGADAVYGQKPVNDEAEKAQIEAILGEKSSAFEDMVQQAVQS